MPGTKLKVISKVEALSSALADDVYRMDYKPGQKITEGEITEKYEVSRNTVREAIAGLLNCGLFIKKPDCGVSVKKITEDDVREIFHFRSLLEAEAVRLIIRRDDKIPDKLLKAMENIEKDPTVQNDWYRFVSSDIDFHTALVQASGSARLSRLYETIRMEITLCLCQSKETLITNPNNIYEHRQFIKALESRDEETAVELVTKHISYGIENIAKGFSKNTND